MSAPDMPNTANTSAPMNTVGASSKPPVVILNPAGNRGRCVKLRSPLGKALMGGRGELVLTTAPGEGQRIAADAAADGRAIIAVGGDGTLMEIASGILSSGRQVPLGIVPAGSGNDYAYYTLKLPRDPMNALDVALNGTPTPFDAGAVNDYYFINSLGIGLDANISVRANQFKKLPLLRGNALYQTASMYEVVFQYHRGPELEVTIDGELQPDRKYTLVAMTVGQTYGGGFYINPTADPTDGLLDTCLILRPPQLEAIRLLPVVKKGKHVGHPAVRQRLARSIVLESPKTIYAHRDGEVFRGKRFEARILPGALWIRHA